MTGVFRHGDLRLYLLSLLAEQPRHGYELIQALGERFGGTYVPSAGTIYPRLAKLEEDGLVTKAADGRKTVYEITDTGRAELAARAGELDGIESAVTDSVRRLADEVRTSVNHAMKTLRADLASAAREARTGPGDAAHEATSVPTTVRVESRVQLQRAEILLSEFRQSIRSELRARVVSDSLRAETVDLLERRLASARKEVLSALDIPQQEPFSPVSTHGE
jgi:DNA-binding PadR family transcriptional regulator